MFDLKLLSINEIKNVSKITFFFINIGTNMLVDNTILENNKNVSQFYLVFNLHKGLLGEIHNTV